MKALIKILIVWMAIFSFPLNALWPFSSSSHKSSKNSNSTKEQARPRFTFQEHLKKKYKEEILKWCLQAPADKEKVKAWWKSLEEIIPAKHKPYRGYLLNKNRGKLAEKMWKEIQRTHEPCDYVRRLTYLVKEWEWDLSHCFYLHSLVQNSNKSGPEACQDLLILANVIELVPNINRRDQQGKTVLHLVPVSSDLGLLKLLIEEGANPNEQDTSGRTLAHYRALKCDDIHAFIQYKFLENYTDLSLVDEAGFTAPQLLHLCREFKNQTFDVSTSQKQESKITSNH